MSAEEFDYRFGWRWLLSSQWSDGTVVVVKEEAERSYLRNWLSRRVAPSANESPAAVIDADFATSSSSARSEALALGASCKHFALYGSCAAVDELSAQLGLHELLIRDYGLIPPGRPRVAVPLSSTSSTLAGLSLHSPGRSIAKLAVRLLSLLARVGIVAPLRRSCFRVASSAPVLPWILEQAEPHAFAHHDFAMYFGVQGESRKTVALPLAEGEGPEWIVKSAEHPGARAKLRNEVNVLRQLDGTRVARHVPAVRSYHEEAAASVLVQQYFQRTPCAASRGDLAVTAFLASAAEIAAERVRLTDYVLDPERVRRGPDAGATSAIWDTLLRKRGDTVLQLGLVHGDFAPWNCGMVAGELVVFDWEEGRFDGVSFDDSFSYVVYQELLLQSNRDAASIAAKALAFAGSVHGDDQGGEMQACFVIWCLSRTGSDYRDIYVAMASLVVENLK